MLISPPADVYEEGELQWKNAVVAQFVGKIPNFSVFQKMVNLLWGEEGEVDLRPAGHNLFIIQFSSSALRDRVLETGPWHIQNKPLIVRKWEPGMESLQLNMAKLPIWIQLGNIPLELFTQRGISYIASAIGNPLYMDRITASQQRLAFAKVCVEVEAAKDIPKIIEVERRNGSIIPVGVEIPWMPMKCSTCCIFGHCDKECPRKLVQATARVWVPKKIDTNEKVVNEEKKDKVTEDLMGKSVENEGDNNQQRKDKGKAMELVQGNGINPQAKAGSVNRFAILDFEVEENEMNISEQGEIIEDELNVEPRKARAVAAGVADLMKSLKPKKKGNIDKVRKKVGINASGGQSSSPLL